jgi:F-type H+-transporting ATPase subunit b
MMGFGTVHAIGALINFVLFAIVIAKFGMPMFQKMLADRQADTQRSLEEANAAERLAAASLAQVEHRLSQLDGEIVLMLEDAAVAARNQSVAVVQAARIETERLKAQARAEIARERQAAVESLRQAVLAQAFERATLELQQKMNAERQRELVHGLVQKVGDGTLVLR